jgi:GntR family transcriptional regulator
MTIDKESPISLHIQIRNDLIALMLRGELGPNDRLPSERELQSRYNVSRTTVRLALRDLAGSGFIYSRPGKGTFVAPTIIDSTDTQIAGLTDNLAKEGVKTTNKILLQEEVPATLSMATLLRVNPKVPLFRLRRLCLADGVPVAINDSLLPLEFCEDLPEQDFEKVSLYETLRAKGLVLATAELMMIADMPTYEEQRLLEMQDNIPVIRIERITLLSNGQPVEYATSAYQSDGCRFNVLLGKGGDHAFFQYPGPMKRQMGMADSNFSELSSMSSRTSKLG